jgi:hypothetical protein
MKARTLALPPIGYRVVAAEQRGAKVKKKLEVDPLHAETVRLIYRLALEGDGTSGPLGVKNITAHLNAHRIFTRDGGVGSFQPTSRHARHDREIRQDRARADQDRWPPADQDRWSPGAFAVLF